MADKLISKIPDGPLSEKWTKRKSEIRLVSPNNKRKLEIIVVGTGLGGASAAASLGELGYNVKIFCISDTPAVHTQSLHRVVLMPPRTIRTTTIPFIVCSTIPSKAVTTVHARLTFTALQR